MVIHEEDTLRLKVVRSLAYIATSSQAKGDDPKKYMYVLQYLLCVLLRQMAKYISSSYDMRLRADHPRPIPNHPFPLYSSS